MNGEKEPYIIVRGDGITELMDAVKRWMKQDYVVTGGVCAPAIRNVRTQQSFYQAMVLKPEPPEDMNALLWQLKCASLGADGNISEGDKALMKEMFPSLTREWT